MTLACALPCCLDSREAGSVNWLLYDRCSFSMESVDLVNARILPIFSSFLAFFAAQSSTTGGTIQQRGVELLCDQLQGGFLASAHVHFARTTALLISPPSIASNRCWNAGSDYDRLGEVIGAASLFTDLAQLCALLFRQHSLHSLRELHVLRR